MNRARHAAGIPLLPVLPALPAPPLVVSSGISAGSQSERLRSASSDGTQMRASSIPRAPDPRRTPTPFGKVWNSLTSCRP